jgi:superfamily II DNA/RNA helicase
VGIKAVPIHGRRTQAQRDQALRQFRDGRAAALVATDVAARGIHVDGVACVVHYDLPEDPKDYVHRSGRTGRAGATGVVVALVPEDGHRAARTLQRQVGVADPVGAPDPLRLGEPRPVPVPVAPAVQAERPAGRKGDGRAVRNGGSGRRGASSSGRGRSAAGGRKAGERRHMQNSRHARR